MTFHLLTCHLPTCHRLTENKKARYGMEPPQRAKDKRTAKYMENTFTLPPDLMLLYCPHLDKQYTKPKKLSNYLDEIRSKMYRKPVENYRLTGDESIKKRLPGIALSTKATAPQRKLPTDPEEKAAFTLKYHSGLILIDIDLKHKPETELAKLPEIREVLRSDPHTVFFFTSISGKGLKASIPIDPKHHEASFEGAYEYYKERYKITIDKQTKDFARLCGISYDPELYFNPTPQLFRIDPDKVKPRPQPVPVHNLPPLTLTLSTQRKAAEKILNYWIRRFMMEARPGNRHNARIRAGFTLGGWIAGGLLTSEEVIRNFAFLIQCTSEPGYFPHAMQNFINALRNGEKRPLHLTERDTQTRPKRSRKSGPRHIGETISQITAADYEAYIESLKSLKYEEDSEDENE